MSISDPDLNRDDPFHEQGAVSPVPSAATGVLLPDEQPCGHGRHEHPHGHEGRAGCPPARRPQIRQEHNASQRTRLPSDPSAPAALQSALCGAPVARGAVLDAERKQVCGVAGAV